jgi:Fur family transcriptional regulator, peroxide stress response regulator
MDSIRAMISAFREMGLKLTRQRLEVINVLGGDKSHPSALNVYRKARKNVPTISLSTVYYTLNILKKHRLIKELEFYDMDNRYEANTTNHLNLVCLKCGSIQDFPGNIPIALANEKVEEHTGFHVVDTRMEYYGYCGECKPRKR